MTRAGLEPRPDQGYKARVRGFESYSLLFINTKILEQIATSLLANTQYQKKNTFKRFLCSTPRMRGSTFSLSIYKATKKLRTELSPLHRLWLDFLIKKLFKRIQGP